MWYEPDMDIPQSVRAHWLSLARHTPLGVICDLDGTLLPFVATPSASRLPPELAELLCGLAALPGLSLAIISGRPREDLERLLGPVPGAWLVAEHGGWRRRAGAWEAAVDQQAEDIEPLAARLRHLAAAVPGALVERKTWSVTFHYRLVSERERVALLVAVDAALEEWLAQAPGFERLDGVAMLEVRPARMRKSLAVPWLREQVGAGVRLLAFGDDLTDEDLFRALGVADEAVLVGPQRRSRARWRLADPSAVAALLSWIAATRRGEEVAPPLPVPLAVQPRGIGSVRGRYELLVVSNRLPDLRRATQPGEAGRTRHVGGLVSALEPVLGARRGLWLGWSGRTIAEPEPGPLGLDDEARPALAWMDFPKRWHRSYYNGFCNRALWPLFHTFPQHVAFADGEWDCYQQVNRAFAAAAREVVSSETPVWLHDYHLLLAAQGLRELGHRGPLGLFLHIPFPAPDLFGLLPWAEQLLDAMLDFDLLGFHTTAYVENFRQTIGALSPAWVSDDAIEHRGRRVRMRAFPIGIIPEPFQEPAEPAVAEEVAALLRAIAPSRLVLGVDRLDYTKGIPERLEAFGRLLQLYPEWRGRVSLVQISVPSRADVPEYAAQRRRIENTVGRINGEYGEGAWVPVRYLYRSYHHAQLAELYRAAAVGYVTPLRDGMNLVAKEFVAAQEAAEPGVLLLSRFAGAAVELQDAVLTNPWHAEGMARDLDRALRMERAERQERHGRLLAVVSRTTATTWAEDFLDALTACR
jgi:alpha,alpha-trehalose-phosphate synthase [UDP-forming]/trehalose-phosphatase